MRCMVRMGSSKWKTCGRPGDGARCRPSVMERAVDSHDRLVLQTWVPGAGVVAGRTAEAISCDHSPVTPSSLLTTMDLAGSPRGRVGIMNCLAGPR